MITYLSIYIYLSIISLSEIKLSNYIKKIFFYLLFLFILIFISGRHYVGGDYITYLNLFNEAKINVLGGFSKLQGLNYVIQFIHILDLDYFFFNFICALIFLSGIFKFLNISDEKLFLFILLIPTMIYVVGMGYTRQSVSIGFLCFAIYYWSENMSIKKIIFFFLAVFIHISSIIFIFLLFFKCNEKIKLTKLLLLITITTSFLFLFYYLYFNNFENLSLAIGLDYKIVENSPLKYLKFLAHILPIIVFLIFIKKFSKDKKLFPLYFFTLISILVVIIAMIVFKQLAEQSSYIDVIADRILLPFILVEALIFVRLCSVIDLEYSFLFKLLILFYFGLMLFVWLEFADNSHAWQPYRSILFESYADDFNKS
ncbi:MAG: hypothetical protein CMA12_00580 [Euryarchaeota archaeon]|nr:hypothetical protein [Euryarchaeota archaeon]OUU06875.1 MAG: hypothetical protein CBB94_14455 [Gammaproteobacteria bacterium TMED34]